MSGYGFLAASAVVLFIFVVLVAVGMIVAAVHLSKAYTARQRYNLVRHAYDKGGHDDLKAMTEAVRSLDRDLRWGPRGDQHCAESGGPSEGTSLGSAETGPRALPRRHHQGKSPVRGDPTNPDLRQPSRPSARVI